MKKNFTLKQLTHFTNQEESLRQDVFGEQMAQGLKQNTVDSILAFSKALSVRKSKTLDHVEMVLN